MFWKIVKWWRHVRIMLRIYSDRGKAEHFLFSLTESITPKDFYEKVIPLHYQYDPFATQYKGQIFSVRKLEGQMQYHVRVYKDGSISGHHEHNYEFDMKAHVSGQGCRTMLPTEYVELQVALGVS